MKRSPFAARWRPFAIPDSPFKTLCYNGMAVQFLRNIWRQRRRRTPRLLGGAEEVPDHVSQAVGPACLALPKDEHAQPVPCHRPAGLEVALDVTRQLRQPIARICGWLLGAETAIMLVPKTAMDEDYPSEARED